MTFSITLQKRNSNEAQAIRAQGFIPAIVYGADRKSESVMIPAIQFEKLYNEAGESSLIDCTVEGEKAVTKVLVQDVQYDPVKNKIIHVDFRQINMNKEMEAALELEFVGEAPAVKELGGTLVKAHSELNIKCLPKDLVSSVSIDLSVLKTFDDVIYVRDLVLPAGIVSTDPADLTVAKVSPPLTEEQIKAMEEEGQKGVEAVEVVEKKKEEEGEEGAAEGADKAAGDKKPAEKK
ncbi:MAG: 50S ribosomal protein L25 [Candidatus Magasanikbacteria bacterium]